MVKRTTIQVDEDILRRAQQALGTSGLKQTVYAAFDQVIRLSVMRDLVNQLRAQEGVDLNDEVLRSSKSW